MRNSQKINPENGYGNIEMYSPNGTLMCFINKKRLSFYLRNNLVEKVGDDKFKLTFEPKGLGWANDGNNFLIKRENKCVVTGHTNYSELTKHHIVPEFFRKHYSEERKRYFHLIVLFDKDLHFKYTIEQHKFYDELAVLYKVPTSKELLLSYHDHLSAIRLANVLLYHIHKTPQKEKRDKIYAELSERFFNLTGTIASTENLLEWSTRKFPEPSKLNLDLGKLIVDKVTDFDAFDRLWLDHFIAHTHPKHLPEDLKLIYNLK